MKTKFKHIRPRDYCDRCEGTGNANHQHPRRPFKPCNHCNGTGWVVARIKPQPEKESNQ